MRNTDTGWKRLNMQKHYFSKSKYLLTKQENNQTWAKVVNINDSKEGVWHLLSIFPSEFTVTISSCTSAIVHWENEEMPTTRLEITGEVITVYQHP